MSYDLSGALIFGYIWSFHRGEVHVIYRELPLYIYIDIWWMFNVLKTL
jgi:hypothetical protein